MNRRRVDPAARKHPRGQQAEDPRAPCPARADGALGHDAPVLAAPVADRRLLNDVLRSRYLDLERGVVEIARRTSLQPRCDGLVHTTVEPDEMPTGPERQPVQVHCRRAGSSRVAHPASIAAGRRPHSLTRHGRMDRVRARIAVAAIAAAVAGLYTRVLRESILNWGATDEGRQRGCPGTSCSRTPTAFRPGRSHRRTAGRGLAVAGPDGPRSAGRRLHVRLDREPAGAQHAQHRPRPSGIPAPEGGETFGIGSNQMSIDRVESERVLAWRSEDGNWVWTFVLEIANRQHATDQPQPFPTPDTRARIGMLPMEPGSLIMERTMLRGIKQRAEHLSSETRSRPT